MPVSSPSYFGPQRNDGSIVGQTAGVSATGDRVFLAGQSAGNGMTVADCLVIGYQAAVGPITDSNFAESIFLGTQAGRVLTTTTGSVTTGGAVTIIGPYACAALIRGDTSIVIGQRAFTAYAGNAAAPGLTRVVAIGNNIARAQTTATNQAANSVLIGADIASGGDTNIFNSVVVGSRAALSASNVSRATIVGTASAQSMQGAQNTILGFSAGNTLTSGQNNTLVGDTANCSTASGSNNVVIGSGASGADGQNTVIGTNAQAPATTSGCIAIGFGAGNPSITASNLFFVETNQFGTHRAILYGDMNAGNLIVGKSENGVDRAFGTGPTNILKLINGTIGDATTRVGGGYFYVNAGALHWVGSGGTDTAIAPA